MLKPLHKYLQLGLHINCVITIVVGMDFYIKLKRIDKISGTHQEQGRLLLQIRNHSLWGIHELFTVWTNLPLFKLDRMQSREMSLVIFHESGL